MHIGDHIEQPELPECFLLKRIIEPKVKIARTRVEVSACINHGKEQMHNEQLKAMIAEKVGKEQLQNQIVAGIEHRKNEVVLDGGLFFTQRLDIEEEQRRMKNDQVRTKQKTQHWGTFQISIKSAAQGRNADQNGVSAQEIIPFLLTGQQKDCDQH